MKTLKTAIIVVALLSPISQANADSQLRDQLNQAQQTLVQDLKLIEQQSRLFQASAHKSPPAIQDQDAGRPAISLVDLSLPGKTVSDVLIETRAAHTDVPGASFSCMISVEFPAFFGSPAPAAR